jgi:hypothetical protein
MIYFQIYVAINQIFQLIWLKFNFLLALSFESEASSGTPYQIYSLGTSVRAYVFYMSNAKSLEKLR